VVNTATFERFKTKVNKLIGIYGSNEGLGNNMIIHKYSRSTNNYGDATDTLVSSTNIKGIILDNVDFEGNRITDLNTKDGELSVYINADLVVKDDGVYHYEFEIDNETYLISRSDIIGRVANTTGIVKEVILKPKR